MIGNVVFGFMANSSAADLIATLTCPKREFAVVARNNSA
jgi:hypothetical protein